MTPLEPDRDLIELDTLPVSTLRLFARTCIEAHIDAHQVEILREAEDSERLLIERLARTAGGAE